MKRPRSRCQSLLRDQLVLRGPVRQAVIDRHRAVPQRSLQGSSGSPRESSRALPHDPADRSALATTDQRAVRRCRATHWARRKGRQAWQRQGRAYGRPEPRAAPPAPISRAGPGPGIGARVPAEWRRPGFPVVPVRKERSASEPLAHLVGIEGFILGEARKIAKQMAEAGAIGPPEKLPSVPARRAIRPRSDDREA